MGGSSELLCFPAPVMPVVLARAGLKGLTKEPEMGGCEGGGPVELELRTLKGGNTILRPASNSPAIPRLKPPLKFTAKASEAEFPEVLPDC